MFELFQSHLRSVKREIEKYSNSIPSLANYHLLHSQRLQDKMLHPQFVISVVGAAKVGKSSFINALLGEDFIPNGETLRSSFVTKIIFSDHDDQVLVQSKDGERVIKGQPLTYAFHQDVKEEAATEGALQYVVRHKFHALREHDPHELIDFIVMDTPSVDLETSDDHTLAAFEEVVQQTDLLLYVFDVSNPQDETTLRALADIRPDLLEDAIFIVNKMDYRATSHFDEEASVQDIWQLLQSYGVHNPKLIPASAKTALFTRMIQKGMQHSEFYWQELASYIPEQELQQATDESELFQSLLKKSGIPMIEEDILAPAFIHLREAARYAMQKGVMRYVGQMSKDFGKNVQKLSWYAQQKQLVKQEIEEHMNQLTSLMAEHHTIAERLKEQTSQAASLLKKDETMRPFSFQMPAYVYHTVNEGFEGKEEALDEARKLLALWMKKEIEDIPEKVSAFYNLGLQDSSKSYFGLIYDVARKELARLNQAIYEYGLHYPKTIDFLSDPKQVDPHQMEIMGKRAIVRNMKMYDNKINIESYKTPYKDKVLLVFHKTKYVTNYKYSIEEAVHFAEQDLNGKIEQFSEMYFEEYMLEKYENYPKRVCLSARNEIDHSLQAIEQVIMQLKEELKQIDAELGEMQDEMSLITELQHRIDNRSKLITATERMNVANGENLTTRLDHATSGTTFFLDEGEFILTAETFYKSAAFVGKGKEKTKLIVKRPLANSNTHDSFFFEDITIEIDHSEDVAFAIDGYSFIAENCSIYANSPAQVVMDVKGATEGSIHDCLFNGGQVTIASSRKFHISTSAFMNHGTAISLLASTQATVMGNFFEGSEYTSIHCKEESMGCITNNHFSNSAQYSIICRDASKATIEKNKLEGSKVCAIFMTDKAKPIISENTYRKNKACVILDKFAASKLTGNTMIENESGITMREDSELELLKNKLESNEKNGLTLIDRANIPTCMENTFLHNQKNGIYIGGAATGKIENNQFDDNAENGIIISMNAEVWIVNNTMANHGFAGILCEGSSRLIMVQNEIDSNANGVYLKDKANVEIEENNILQNKRYGIRISDSVNGVVKGNECQENGISAFWVDTAKEMEFTDNKLVESGLALFKPQYWNSKMKMQRSNQKAKRIRRSKQTRQA
ncbi:right-handed parallel beta-helix repeat-containing protein [Ectobacillus polymachus]|uniref:right-handed parallel beta-helix repeat-containing protein n=1 Tax=Ectobacillus polymachus TaxID=1508806 RepID=UPI003A89BAC4